MAIDLRDGVFASDGEAEAAEALPRELADAEARERAEEDAVFVASSRARLGADQSRAFKKGAEQARQTGGVGFAQSFLDGFRAQAEDTVSRAQAPGFEGPKPGDHAVTAFLDRAEQDADVFVDRAAVVETGARANRRLREGMDALEAVRQSAFDDPDGLDEARLRQDDVVAAIGPMVGDEEAERIRSRERARLAESAVQGRIAGAPDAALRVLDDPNSLSELPEDRRSALKEAAKRRVAALEHDRESEVEQRARAEVLKLAADGQRFSAEFSAKAERGEAREVDIADALDQGMITPQKADALRAKRVEEDRRIADRIDRVARVQNLVDAGEVVDPTDPEQVGAAETYWEDVALPALRETPPEQRPAIITSAIKEMGIVPEASLEVMRDMWDSGLPDLSIAVAKSLTQLMGRSPPFNLARLLEIFTPRESAVQRRAIRFIKIGVDPKDALERANELEPPIAQKLPHKNDPRKPPPEPQTLPAEHDPTKPPPQPQLLFAEYDDFNDQPPISDHSMTPTSVGGEAADSAHGIPADLDPTAVAAGGPEAASAAGGEAGAVGADSLDPGAAAGAEPGAADQDQDPFGADAFLSDGEAEQQVTGPESPQPDSGPANPWEKSPVSDQQKSEIDALFGDIETVTKETLPEIEQKIRTVFKDSPKFADRMIQKTRESLGIGLSGPDGQNAQSAARRSLQEHRRRIAGGEDFDVQRRKDHAAFAALEQRSEYKIRPSEKGDGRFVFSRKDGAGEAISVSPKLGRVIASLQGRDLEKFQFIHDVVSGRVSGDGLKDRARDLLTQTDGGTPGVSATEILDTTAVEAFGAAQKALKDGKKKSAVMAALMPVVYPEMNRDPDAVMNTALDVMPIVGEIRSAIDAVESLAAVADALSKGDYEGAVKNGLLTVLHVAGAVPGFGALVRPIKAAVRQVIRKNPILDKAHARFTLAKFERQGPKSLETVPAREAFGKQWDSLPDEQKKSLEGSFRVMVGESTEKEVTQTMKRAGAGIVKDINQGSRRDLKVNVGKNGVEFDQVTKDKLVTVMGLFTYPKKSRHGTVIETKANASALRPHQRRAQEEIKNNPPGTFKTKSPTDPIDIGDATLYRTPLHEVSWDNMEEVARKHLEARIGRTDGTGLTRDQVEGMVASLGQWHKDSRKETITLGQALGGIVVGAGYRSGTNEVEQGRPAEGYSLTDPIGP